MSLSGSPGCNLKIKETDRIEALKAEMKRLGYVLYDEDDSILYWNGERIEPQACPVIKTYEDHRMAMAFAPAAIHYRQYRSMSRRSYPSHIPDIGTICAKPVL